MNFQPVYRQRRHWPKRVIWVLLLGSIAAITAAAATHFTYNRLLQPVSDDPHTIEIVVKKGATDDQIGQLLQEKKVIKSSWAFRRYVSSKSAQGSLKAGTYEISPSQSVPEIVSQLTHGKIVTNLVTILPGKRLDQIRTSLIQFGFSEESVDAALNPASYAGNSALVDKPVAANLEGYLYPDSYQRTAETTPKVIIQSALKEMDAVLTPELRDGFARQGLSTYQGIILASIVENEVSNTADREKVAQVFLKRLKIGMKLESNVTSDYGAALDGQKGTSKYPSPFNTYLHAGLPPTPVGNVTKDSLRAVAFPASTDWLYFVSGDDGTTHFSNNLAEHEANVRQYCTKNCGQ